MKKKLRLGEVQRRLLEAIDEFCAEHEDVRTRAQKISCVLGGKFAVDLAIRKSPSLARGRR